MVLCLKNEDRGQRTAVSLSSPFNCCPLIHTSRRADLLVRERCMNVLYTEQKSAGGAVVSDTANTRLTGSWLIIARVVWLALVVPSLGLFVANLLVYDQQLQRACVGPLLCGLTGALTAKELQALSTSGFSVSGYAALLTIFVAIIVSLWCAVGF